MGVSHRSAPMSLLERVSLSEDKADSLVTDLLRGDHIDEVAVLATCNRLEVYAEASTFHGCIDHIGTALSRVTGVSPEELEDAYYVHYEDRAIAHVFSVACGLDAMAVGEAQILGQLRHCLARGQEAGSVGPQLNLLLQHALRVGKRAHSDTDLDHYGASLVETGLDMAESHVGDLGAATVLVVGAGAMSSLVATTASRRGVGTLVITNRTPEKSARLADATGAATHPWEDLVGAVRGADVVISCTGATGHVLDAPLVAAAFAERAGAPSAFVDLALPRDIDPAVGDAPGALVIGLEDLGRELASLDLGDQALHQVEDLVVSEVAAFLLARRQEAVAPAVTALRRQAAQVVNAELARLDARLPHLDPATRDELGRTVHRVVEKLLHTPTVRVKELTASGAGTGDYAKALRELFDLDAAHVATVARPPVRGGAKELS